MYSTVEDFIKAVEVDKNFSFLIKKWNGKRGSKRRLSVTQVISLNLLRFALHIKDLKAFHNIIKAMDFIPGMPNYLNIIFYDCRLIARNTSLSDSIFSKQFFHTHAVAAVF